MKPTKLTLGQSQKAISITAGATIPDGTFMINGCAFSGGIVGAEESDYLEGATVDDNRIYSQSNINLRDSQAIGAFAVDKTQPRTTTFAGANIPIKVVMSTTGNKSRKWEVSGNRLIYKGSKPVAIKPVYKGAISTSLINQNINVYVYYFDTSANSGSIQTDSVGSVITKTADEPHTIMTGDVIIDVDYNDYIELWAERTTAQNATMSMVNCTFFAQEL